MPTTVELRGVLEKIFTRLMKMLTSQGYLVEEQGMTYLADLDAHNPLRPMQAASCTYRIAFGPRAGHKVLSLQTISPRDQRAHQHCAPVHTASACTRRCAVVPIRARTSNVCAATSPALPLPTNASNATAPAKSCCGSRAPTATAPPISS